MGSGHNHLPHSHLESQKNLAIAFALNLFFAVFEFAGGLYVGSVAVLSNAVHDAGDAMTLGLGLFLQRRSERGPSENFSYGLRRLSLLSAAISALVIGLGAIYIVVESIPRLGKPGEPQASGMMLMALVGISMNGLAAWRLHSGETQNEKVLSWHSIEDMLGWVGVLLSGVFIWFFDWRWMDAALAIAVSLFVLFNISRQLINTVSLFLQGNPDPGLLHRFKDAVLAIPGVVELHDLHFWSLDGAHHVLSMHVVTAAPLARSLDLKNQIRAHSHHLGECHLTIEVESPDDHCHDNCDDPHENHHAGHKH